MNEGGEPKHAQFLGQDMAARHWGWVEEDTVVRRLGEGLTRTYAKSRLLGHTCITHSDTGEDDRHRFVLSCCSHKRSADKSQESSLKEVIFQPENKLVMVLESWSAVEELLLLFQRTWV